MDWRSIAVLPDHTILHTMEAIDRGTMQIALVTDSDKRLLGTVTDGDIRRGILKGKSLDAPVTEIMNNKPIIGFVGEDQDKLMQKMRFAGIRQIPVVDQEGRVIYLETLKEISKVKRRDNWVVLMAGGLGSRLRPLTEKCPKPLLEVGGKPLLETIIENFKIYGFYKFFISVNYKAEMIEKYFGSGIKHGVEIKYIRENKRLGTAGALSLLPQNPSDPLIVMNGDLLTKVNFTHMLDFHHQQRGVATMCLRDYEFQVPYGVIDVDRSRLIGISEKPVFRHFVNAGIYVLNPEVLTFIPKNSYYDMTTLFETLINNHFVTSAFPIREYWMDIGRIDDFEQANNEFYEVFG
ncbi:UTP--glucose-1-phosphate uridylyltransferase [Paenibacillus sp. CECT 9249]|uniref:nucleotidyltransferase family protein n=1 Tax=Paenibacillus sp. CECT 9249 TaxID=2845385 RepID=UPI001E31129A|nr:nucleotidyltransferase family protein [Paenibacillus sp. CECT 9249]CAH0117997.1 UTP--glucose-1-phosphate uridylyltransferase [Paenibacillus sp. CECT 9249]